MAKTAKMEDPKRKCAELCVKALVRCAEDIEKAMAACGVRIGIDVDDPAGFVIEEVSTNLAPRYEPGRTTSSWKPTKQEIRDLAYLCYFRKARAKKGGR